MSYAPAFVNLAEPIDDRGMPRFPLSLGLQFDEGRTDRRHPYRGAGPGPAGEFTVAAGGVSARCVAARGASGGGLADSACAQQLKPRRRCGGSHLRAAGEARNDFDPGKIESNGRQSAGESPGGGTAADTRRAGNKA